MEIEFFDVGTRSPVDEFLDSLQKKERAKVLRNISLLKEFGLDAGANFVEPLGGGLFSLKTIFSGVFIRILFFTVVGNMAVILSGFKKKTNKIPAGEINLAKRRRKEYLQKQGGNYGKEERRF